MVVLKLSIASLPKHPLPQQAQAQPSSTSGLPRIRLKSSATTSTKIRIRNQKDVGLGYDSEASDREDDPLLEEQIILRVKSGEDAEYLQRCLDAKEVPDVMIKFKGSDS
jgi:transcription initiation factor TFIID subunit 7